MTKDEIILLKEILELVVEHTVRKVLREEAATKQDLREVKLLMAKIIKEASGMAPAENVERPSKKGQIDVEQLREMFKADSLRDPVVPVQESYQQTPGRSLISSTEAQRYMQTGDIPDYLDAPIPHIDTTSDLFKDLQERLK